MTFRCSDYRRAMVLRYLKLKEYNCEKILTEIFRTRLEISQLTTTERNKQYWHYIIQTFIHGLLCSQLFSNPCSDYDKLQDVWTILSLFNHTHSERIISMRSINTRKDCWTSQGYYKGHIMQPSKSSNHQHYPMCSTATRRRYILLIILLFAVYSRQPTSVLASGKHYLHYPNVTFERQKICFVNFLKSCATMIWP